MFFLMTENNNEICEDEFQKKHDVFFRQFNDGFRRYKKAVDHLASFDCLFSLASVAKGQGFCRYSTVNKLFILIYVLQSNVCP